MDLKELKKWILALFVMVIVIVTILVTLILLKTKEDPKSETEQKEEEHIDVIQYTKYNEISYAYISDMQLCNIYLLDYKNNAIYHPQQAYDSLDKDYREKRFGSFENYQKYVQANANRIFGTKLSKYQVNENDKGNEYICIDQYGNYYIFQETAIMKYKLLLDSYTIDLPQYVEIYNRSTSTEQAAMSVERFVKAIHDENYMFAYSVLSSGFKDNYFKTQEQFETYVKQNFIKGKEITYNSTKEEGDMYIFEATISDSENLNNTMTKNFVVRLGEGTNFELSFEI